jgi:carboxypeptidase T
MRRASLLLFILLIVGSIQPAQTQPQPSFVYHAYDFTGISHVAGFGSWEFRSLKADLSALAQQYPQIAQMISLGQSHEGRDIWAIKISDDVQTEDLSEPEALFIGGQHAREWIGVEVPFLIAQYLVQNYATDERVQKLIDNLEIWIVPMVNPDGHEYTRLDPCLTAPEQLCRLWRKNRRDMGNGIFGVDLNRNWGFQWDSRVGGSRNPQSIVYRGPAPFSEPEIRAVRDLVLDPHRRFKAFIDYHSFSQIVGSPWAYTFEPPVPLSEDARFNPPSDAAEYTQTVEMMAQLIQGVHGQTYQACQISLDCPYPAAGVSTDWFYSETGGLSLLVELRPLTSTPGFVLPTEQIQPTFEENLPAALYVLEHALPELIIHDSIHDDGSVPSLEIGFSPDIRVDGAPLDILNSTEQPFGENDHEDAVAGAINRVYVTVHNRGFSDISHVIVELYWKDNSQLDPSVWPEGWHPIDNDTDPLNESTFRHFVAIPAREATTVTFSWVPTVETPDATLLVRVRHLQDPIRLVRDPSMRFELDRHDNNIASRRLQVLAGASSHTSFSRG